MQKLGAFTIVSILVCASAAAQIAPHYADWGDGPARVLMTKDEIRQWKAVSSDRDAEAFIALFWARRDPTPSTPRNEFREEFDRRVDIADRYFSSSNTRGAVSDPGKVLILLGPPWQIGGKGSTFSQGMQAGGVDSSGSVSVPSPRGEPAQQTWTYAHSRKPAFIPEDRLVLVFLDEGLNEWQLAVTERTNPKAVLLRAVQALIVSPDLKAAPAFPPPPASKEFKSAGLRSAYQQFRDGGEASLGPAQLTWDEFLSNDGRPFIAAQLYAAAGSGLDAGLTATRFSVVENAAGEIVAVDESPAALTPSAGDSYVDATLRLAPGPYTVTLGLLGADGAILTAQRARIDVAPMDPSAAGLSPLILSNNVSPLQGDPAAFTPFTFGALKVVPKGDLMFVPKGDLWYFVEVRKPGVNDQGKPALSVQVDVEGKTRKGPVALHLPLAPADAPLLKGTDDRYAVGQALPLEGFSPGEYTIRVRIIDTVREKTWELAKTFFVRGL